MRFTLIITLTILTLTAGAKACGDYTDFDEYRSRGYAGLQQAIDEGMSPYIIDTIAGQRHAYISRLFWHTDLDAAITDATAQNKPILSLRMLGQLTDEHSCANSRYFRTTLYANEKVSALLREHFVLHWQSVRDVPRITIDFGDGRQIDRTITGNSVHWILDPNGQPVDALPGLYASAMFMQQVQAAGTQALRPRDTLAAWHGKQLTALNAAWQSDVKEAGININVELTDDQWQQIAWQHQGDVQFDEPVMKLMAQQANPDAPDAAIAMPLAASKSQVETPMLRMVRRFRQHVSLDTVKNQYTFHRRVHEWFINDGAAARPVENLNQRVYAELFRTPLNDPWLGMAPPDAFAALDNGGLRIMVKE